MVITINGDRMHPSYTSLYFKCIRQFSIMDNLAGGVFIPAGLVSHTLLVFHSDASALKLIYRGDCHSVDCSMIILSVAI